MYIRLINGGEKGIIEPFFDGGEAYSDYHKYVTLNNYEIEPPGAAKQTWANASFAVLPHKKTTAQRNCDLDTGRFDEIYVEAKLPTYAAIRLTVNGEETINQKGTGKNDEYYGKLNDRQIKSIRLEFENCSDTLYDAAVSCIGVRDSKFPSNEEIKGTNTIPDWEGCFEEKPKIELYTSFFEEDGEHLREKMKSPFYAKTYEKTKELALKYYDYTPENDIERIIINRNGVEFYNGAVLLSFVGFIEKDIELIKIGARYALSLASCRTWYVDEKELAVGITWNNRVFREAFASFGISLFLEFGGSILTWHGRNYLYEALVNKGISRLDGDFKRMEYIYHMNQGLAFSPGYIYGLICLTKRFPRYKKRIDEIEADVDEMLSGTINPDGGIVEGLGYYGYTIESYCLTACALAKYRGKSIYEYINGRLDKASDFMLTMTGGKNIFRTVGDTGRYGFGRHICMFMYQATRNPLWKKYHEIVERKNPEGSAVGGWNIAYLLFGEAFAYDESEDVEIRDGFYCFPDCGYTYLKRDGVEFFAVSGKSFSHCHPDKGSFTIDLDGEPILIDRGMVGYNEACADEISATAAHNTAVPIVDGYMINQNSQHGYGSTMRVSRYENGVFKWVCDNDNVWDKTVVKKNVRTIISSNPYEYEITDEFEFTKPLAAAVILNMYDDKHITAEPVNWVPEKRIYEPFSCDYAKKEVMRLRLISEKGEKLKLVTRVTVNR